MAQKPNASDVAGNSPCSPGPGSGALCRHQGNNMAGQASTSEPWGRMNQEDVDSKDHPQIPHHRWQFFQTLDTLRTDGSLCDVTLVCDGVDFCCHKVALAASSPYFHTMFLGSFPESRADRVELRGIESSALEVIINFMYTARLHVCQDNVEVIISAANMLQMDLVRDRCCQLLFSQLSPANCLQVWHIADLYACADLCIKVENYIHQYFTEIVKSPDFMLLPKDRLQKLVASDMLTVPSEESVFQAVITWVRHDEDQRSDALSDLLKHVRLPLLSKDYLVNRVKDDPLISSNLECTKLVMEAMTYYVLKDGQCKSNSVGCEVKPRTPAGVEKVMIVFGGEDEAAIQTMECYSFREKNWTPAQSMPVFLSKAGCAVHKGLVYLIGGYNGSRHLRTVITYDPAKDTFAYVASMHYVRSEVGVGVLEDRIYAIGGFDGSASLRTVEYYDLACNKWKMASPMISGKCGVGVGVVDGLLYVIGGIDREVLVCSMECYDPKSDTWSVVPGVKCPKKHVGVVDLSGYLYVAGGRYNDESSSLKVHCFDPKSNKLKQIKDMPCTFPSPSLLALDNMLYVDGRIKFLVYNPETENWTELRGKSVYRHHSMAAIVERPIKI